MKIRVKRVKGLVSKIDPCIMCGERVNANAIECTACKAWVHGRKTRGATSPQDFRQGGR